MAYKNTNGTSSIANEFGQWRYFNSALKKLGKETPDTVSITPRDPFVKQEINWLNVAGDVIKGAMGAFEARKQVSYDLADDYLKKHSIEEYHTAMKNGSIPFQDDPIAMQRLKYDHGKLVFQLSEQDFQERVNKGEFVGMEPEQVDALHYEHSKKSMQEVSDVFGYANGSDYWFNEGFFADSEASRIKTLLRSSEVTNDRLVQQRLTNDIAKVVGLINSGELAPESIASVIADTYNQNGYRYSPEDLSTFSNAILKAIGNSEKGDKALEVLEDVEVPGTGISFKEYIGEAGIETVKKTSENLRFNMDAKAMYDFKSKVDQWVDNGDIASIRGALNRELAINGNVKTDRTEYLFKSVDNARNTQQRALATATKETGFNLASSDWASYLLNCIEGKEGLPTIEDKKVQYEGSGFNSIHRDQVAQQVVNKVFSEGNPTTINKLFNYVARTSNTYPALKNYVAKEINDRKADFEETLVDYTAKGSVDTKKYEVSDYTFMPVGSNTPVTVKRVPKSLQTLLSVYHINPSAFSKMADKGIAKKMRQADMAIRLGKNPMDVLGNNAKYEAEYARKASLERLPDRKPVPLKHSLVGGGDVPLTADSSNMLDVMAYSFAIEYKNADPTVPYADTIKAGMEHVKSSYYQVGTVAVPRVSIESSFVGMQTNESKMADVGRCASVAFSNYLKKIGVNNGTASYYDESSDEIVIVDPSGIQRGSIKASELSSLAYEEYKKDLKLPFYKKIFR